MQLLFMAVGREQFGNRVARSTIDVISRPTAFPGGGGGGCCCATIIVIGRQ